MHIEPGQSALSSQSPEFWNMPVEVLALAVEVPDEPVPDVDPVDGPGPVAVVDPPAPPPPPGPVSSPQPVIEDRARSGKARSK
jgi:hypothetical protein